MPKYAYISIDCTLSDLKNNAVALDEIEFVLANSAYTSLVFAQYDLDTFWNHCGLSAEDREINLHNYTVLWPKLLQPRRLFADAERVSTICHFSEQTRIEIPAGTVFASDVARARFAYEFIWAHGGRVWNAGPDKFAERERMYVRTALNIFSARK